MRLKRFDPVETPSTHDSVPQIHMSTKGRFSLNKHLIKLLEIQHGDKVVIFQDANRKMDWYIRKALDTEPGYRISADRVTSKKRKSSHQRTTFNAAYVRTAIRRILNTPYDSGTIRVSEDEVHSNGEIFYKIEILTLTYKGKRTPDPSTQPKLDK